ncbi:hypothetical protein AAHE18_04G165900 [Arachis hypogaea]
MMYIYMSLILIKQSTLSLFFLQQRQYRKHYPNSFMMKLLHIHIHSHSRYSSNIMTRNNNQ